MAIRFIEAFKSVDDVPSLPGQAGIGCVGDAPFWRTTQGVLYGLGPASLGKSFYLDPKNGNDSNSGLSPLNAVKTLAVAFGLCTAGAGDTIYLISDGSTAATARISSTFTWNKANTHLVGIASGVNISNRARIAPQTTDLTFANFFKVTVSGCLFAGLEWFHGFTLGGAAEVCLWLNGAQRNLFVNCHVCGFADGDAAGGADTGSRDILMDGGAAENQFLNCTIGDDTEARSVACASVELKAGSAGSARNVFRNCRFIAFATAATYNFVLVAAAAAIDRFNSFESCLFINSIKSGAGTSITGLAKLAAAAGGLLFFSNPLMVGVSSLGADATSKTQIYVAGAAVNSSAGIGVNPA